MISVHIYGGCWLCHDDGPFRKPVQYPNLSASECIDRRACRLRVAARDPAIRRLAEDAIQRALAAALAEEVSHAG